MLDLLHKLDNQDKHRGMIGAFALATGLDVSVRGAGASGHTVTFPYSQPARFERGSSVDMAIAISDHAFTEAARLEADPQVSWLFCVECDGAEYELHELIRAFDESTILLVRYVLNGDPQVNQHQVAPLMKALRAPSSVREPLVQKYSSEGSWSTRLRISPE